MKNKKAVYFLLPVVLLIWAIIFYRIFTGTGGNDTTPYLSGNVQESTYKAPEKKEYELLLNYPDPFFAPKPVRSIVEGKKERAEVPSRDDRRRSFNWERVIYRGTIEHSNKKTTIALVEYLGKSYMLQKGVPQDNIHLLTITRDSIKVKIGSESAYIRKHDRH